MILSDVRSPTLGIVCEACGRRGRYNVEKLMAEHGDAKLTDLLATLASQLRGGALGQRPQPMQGGVRGARCVIYIR